MDNKYCEYQKILLNLKWFVKQLCRIFEERLERYCAKHQWSHSNSIIEHDSLNGSVCSYPKYSSSQSTPKHGSWTQSLSNSPLMKRLSALQKHSGSPLKRVTNLRSPSPKVSRLLLLKNAALASEREKYMKRFGEHICVVYEYQIGMLNSLHAVTGVVIYVVDLLLKAIKKGILLGIDSVHLNPTILFDTSVMPKSGSKLVKTVGIGLQSNSLTWRVGNIFTHPGLRHNQVGGEDCSNLSIVTHLLTGFCPFGESRRPDIYGYRNLIVVPKRRGSKESENESILKELTFEISLYDSATISHARTHSTESTPTTSTNTLLDHIHKCYKSIFFLIFDKPTVIEHLMACQSFRIFCTKELITPVMFLNCISDQINHSNHRSLFNNFDLFKICVTAKPRLAGSRPISIALSDHQPLSCSHTLHKKPSSEPDKELQSLAPSMLLNEDESDSTSETTGSFISREYDNFGFNI